MNKPAFKVLSIIILLVLPLLISGLVSYSAFDWLETQNDWIGFWGGYLGGLFTLGGVIITIKSSTTDSNEKQRLSVIPYISIERNAPIHVNEKEIPIGLIHVFSESMDDGCILYFDEISILGKCQSVGLGPIINCKIKNIKIGERAIGSGTSKVSVIAVNEETHFILQFNSLGLSSKHLGKEFVTYYNEFQEHSSNFSQLPENYIKFSFYFEDVLGHKYKQKAVYRGQLGVTKEGSPNDINILFVSISSPKLMKKN